MLHYQVVRTSPGGATLSNKMNNTVNTLALMCAKNHLLIFSSFLDIWENVEWPCFLDHPVNIGMSYTVIDGLVDFVYGTICNKMNEKKQKSAKKRRVLYIRTEYSMQYPVIRKSTTDFCTVCSADINISQGGIGDIRH